MHSHAPLNDGRRIPLLGFGVYRSVNPLQSSRWALKAGYRQIDSASYYQNEHAVSAAVMSSGIARDEIWFTSKVRNDEVGSQTARAVDVSLAELQTGDYYDLYLLHGPTNGKAARIEGWRTLYRAKRDGKLKSIGVSNFGVRHLQELAAEGLPTPAINQIEASRHTRSS